MPLFETNDMAEATRLTRAGRLGEATALIQRLLRRPHPPVDDARPAADGRPAGDERPADQAWRGPTIDLEPAEPALGAPAPGIRPAAPRHPEARPTFRPVAEFDLEPGAGGQPGQWLAGVHANPFGQRPYKLYVPASRTGQAMPLVVMLHGCTQGPDDFAAGTGMNRLAEALGFLVAYPGQVEAANPSRCWNWFQPTDQARERGEPSLIAGIVRDVVAGHGADPARIYVAGLSAGGAQALIMARAYPDLFAAVGVHSGLAYGSATDVPSALLAMRRPNAAAPRPGGRFVPTIVFHGDRDRTVHPGNAAAVLAQALADAQAQQVGALDVAVEAGRVPGGHGFERRRHVAANGRPLVEDWRVAGLGHAWSGGDPRGTYADPAGPDASRAMAAFFLRHRLP